MSTELDIDMDTLVGEMPDQTCEALTHNDKSYHGDDEATHYAQMMHQCASDVRPYLEIYPVCSRFAAFLSKGPGIKCTTCGQRFPDRADWIRVVGPIS